jgi:hypothetical protein
MEHVDISKFIANQISSRMGEFTSPEAIRFKAKFALGYSR